MIFGVPITLIAVYALYRMNEYYMLRRLRSMAGALPGEFSKGGQLFLSTVLFPARVFGWVFLLYYGFCNGWLSAVILIAVAFPLSLMLQTVPVFLVRGLRVDLDGMMTALGLVLLPVSALLMFLFLPPA